jgi:hypothetical protein
MGICKFSNSNICMLALNEFFMYISFTRGRGGGRFHQILTQKYVFDLYSGFFMEIMILIWQNLKIKNPILQIFMKNTNRPNQEYRMIIIFFYFHVTWPNLTKSFRDDCHFNYITKLKKTILVYVKVFDSYVSCHVNCNCLNVNETPWF